MRAGNRRAAASHPATCIAPWCRPRCGCGRRGPRLRGSAHFRTLVQRELVRAVLRIACVRATQPSRIWGGLGSSRPHVSRPAVKPQTTKSYWVKVTGTCGTKQSNAALLSVLPTFTTVPADATVCAGQNATFSVVVTGDPLTYEWRRLLSGSSTSEVIGGNSPTVTVAATATMQVWCNAKSGNSGWVASSCATLTPAPGPTISGTHKTRRAGGSYHAVCRRRGRSR